MGLERLQKVAAQLRLNLIPATSSNETQNIRGYKAILVAGTNGKGSSIAAMQSLALAANLKVMSYTSPHFLRFTERLLINGQEVSEAVLTQALHQVNLARLACQPEVSLTYFEFTTLACLLIIQQEAPDLALLEVGLGGKLDAVNLVSADLSLLTNVAQDHADFLGTDLEQIGVEKAGIFRSNQPVVLASQNLPASVLKQAKQLNCPVFQLGKDFTTEDLPANTQLPLASLAAGKQAMAVLYPEVFTTANASAKKAKFDEALANASLVGRRQKLGAWLLDVAHNPAAADYLAASLTQDEQQPAQRLAIVGMMADKDLAATLKPLIPLVDTFITTNLPLPRAASTEELAQVLTGLGAKQVITTQCPQATEAVAKAEELLTKGYQQALVMGSFFTLAEVLPQLTQQVKEA